MIARAHQLVQEGFKYMFNDTLVTVWSAPNYCYRCGNSASIMQVDENGKAQFKVYEAAIENNTDQKNPALRRLVCPPDSFSITDRTLTKDSGDRRQPRHILSDMHCPIISSPLHFSVFASSP